jgi:SAM-dependent methyltransferase
MQRGWSLDEYSKSLQSDSFSEFLMKAVEIYPDGPVSAIFRPYLEQCKEVGRQENLKEDLLRILNLAGERLIPEVVASAKIISVEIDASVRMAATAPKAILEKVMETEKNLCGRWGYANIPSKLIGPKNTCLSPYIDLGQVKKEVFTKDFLDLSGDNEILINNKVITNNKRKNRIVGLAILEVVRSYDFKDKDVLDIRCTDGAYCFYAESQGAKKVVGINRDNSEIQSRLKSTLNSKVTFLKNGFYGLEQEINQKFDVVMCFNLLQTSRYPFLLMRTLSRLMKEDGELILECDYLNGFDSIPILFCPLGSESPVSSTSCTFFNKLGLVNALTSFGFHSFEFKKEVKIPVAKTREYWQFDISGKGDLHAIESAAGSLVMTCKWNPKITDQDKRYLTDLVPGTYIMDGWDAGLIQDNFPEQLTNEEIVSRNRAQTASLSEAYHFSELKHQEFRSAVIDRDNAISDMHSELSKYSVELENIRQTLIERTFLLEQTTTALDLANKELDTRTQELVENRQDLASRSELLEQTTTALDLANKELDTRTQELVENRQDLASRSKLLDDSNLALSKVTDELILLRDLLFERTQMLEVLLAEKKSI